MSLSLPQTNGHFRHSFDQPLEPSGLGELIGGARERVGTSGVLRELPPVNLQLVQNIATVMIEQAYNLRGRGWPDHAGLYVIGSRANGGVHRGSDLDLLIATTTDPRGPFRTNPNGVYEDFHDVSPDTVPPQYQQEYGGLAIKEVVRLEPVRNGSLPALPVDISLVHFPNFGGLRYFEQKLDVDKSGLPLARIPLVELACS